MGARRTVEARSAAGSCMVTMVAEDSRKERKGTTLSKKNDRRSRREIQAYLGTMRRASYI